MTMPLEQKQLIGGVFLNALAVDEQAVLSTWNTNNESARKRQRERESGSLHRHCQSDGDTLYHSMVRYYGVRRLASCATFLAVSSVAVILHTLFRRNCEDHVSLSTNYALPIIPRRSRFHVSLSISLATKFHSTLENARAAKCLSDTKAIGFHSMQLKFTFSVVTPMAVASASF